MTEHTHTSRARWPRARPTTSPLAVDVAARSTSSLPRTGPMQSLAGGIDGRLLLPYGDLLSRRALLQKRLHGDDAASANGPDPRHRNVEVPFPEPARADEPPEH